MRTSYTILYVDDDQDDLLFIAEAFEKYTDHLRVIHAGNGAEGLATLRNMEDKGSLPCLLILDINMPVMNGKEMLKRVKEHPRYKNIPVILFSTSSNPLDKKFAENLGADFITKPSCFNDLESLVDEFVSKCKLDQEERA